MELQHDYSRKSIRQSTYVFVGLAFLCLLPFLVLAFSAHPVADDYTFSAMFKRMGWLGFQKHFYMQWQGVFTTNAFMVSPLSPVAHNRFDLYWCASWATLICFVACTWYIVNYLLNDTPVRLLVVCAIIVIYLYQLPSPVQAFYWLNVVWAYQFCLNLLLLWVVFLLKAFEDNRVSLKWWLVAAVTIFLLIGANLILAVMGVFAVFVGVVINITNKQTRFWWLAMMLVALTSFAIVVLAPGNAVRIAETAKDFKQTVDLAFYIHGLVHGTVMFVYSVVNWLGNGMLIGMTVLALPGMAWLSKQPQLRINRVVRNPWLVLAVSVAAVAMLFFPTYLIQGGPPPPRITNMIYHVFILMWFISVYALVAWSLRVKNLQYNVSVPVNIAVGIFILTALLTDHNSGLIFDEKGKSVNRVYRAYADIVSGQARRFDAEQKERYAIMQQPGSAGLVLKPLTAKPETIFLADLSPDANFWFNEAYADFFGKQYVKIPEPPAAAKQ